MAKSLGQIRDDYYAKKYHAVRKELPPLVREGTTFDEEKSVKWNREEVARRNAERDMIQESNRKAQSELDDKFYEDVISAIMYEYPLNRKQAEKLYSHAYSEGHSGGYSEVINEIYTAGELIEEILKLAK